MREDGGFTVTVQDQLTRARRSRARYEVLLRKGQASPIEVQEARDMEAFYLEATREHVPELAQEEVYRD